VCGGEFGEGAGPVRGRGEEIGNDDDQAAAAGEAGDFGKGGFEVGVATVGRAGERGEDVAEVAGTDAGCHHIVDTFVKKRGADEVALLMEEPGERGHEGAGVVGFGDAAGAEGHGGAGVEEEPAPEVGFVLVFFDEMAVGAGEDAPVEVAQVVAGSVLAVFGELGGKAGERTAVEAGADAFHDEARAEFEVADGEEGGGIEGRGWAWGVGSGCARGGGGRGEGSRGW